MDAYTEAPGILDGPKTVIVGEVNAGEAAKVRKQVNALIASVNTSTFDLMELLYEVRTKKFYLPKFDSFAEFADSLDMKPSKTYYLTRIRERMVQAGIDRTAYEAVGVTKLRVIAMLEPANEAGELSQPILEQIKTLVSTAANLSLDEIKNTVDEYQGNVGDEAWDYMNFKLKKSAKSVVRQAIELIKMQIGSVGKDSEGISKDASDGNALEKLALDFLSDPNNNPNE